MRRLKNQKQERLYKKLRPGKVYSIAEAHEAFSDTLGVPNQKALANTLYRLALNGKIARLDRHHYRRPKDGEKITKYQSKPRHPRQKGASMQITEEKIAAMAEGALPELINRVKTLTERRDTLRKENEELNTQIQKKFSERPRHEIDTDALARALSE